MKLQHVLSLATFSMGAIGLTALVADRALTTRRLLEARLKARGEAVAESVASLLRPQLEAGTTLPRRTIDLFGSLPGVDYITVQDRQGRPLYESSVLSGQFRTETSTNRIHVRYDVSGREEKLGSVQVGLARDRVLAQTRRLTTRGAVLAGIVLLLLAGLSWTLGRLLGRFLDRFAEALEHYDPSLAGVVPWFLRGSVLERAWTAFSALHARLEQEKASRLRTERLKDDLAGMIVHDLKHPLTILKTVILLIRDPSFGDTEAKSSIKPLDMADRAVSRLNAMIEEVLQIARLNTAELSLSRTRLVLQDFLGSCAEENRLIVEHSGRVFRLNLDAEAGNHWIYAEKPLLERLIGNLILNALEHSPPDAAVTLGCRMAGLTDRIEIFVHNEGSHISKGQIAKAFAKFATSGEDIRNVGLGLAFCNLVAQRHEGRLSAVSEEGRGTTFILSLPATTSPSDTAEHLATEPPNEHAHNI